jgi:hypothetical protein
MGMVEMKHISKGVGFDVTGEARKGQHHYVVHQTCAACPEQYDVMFENHTVGYLRLRFGEFSARYPNAGGITVLKEAVGDAFTGEFPDDTARKLLIKRAVEEIDKAMWGRYTFHTFEFCGDCNLRSILWREEPF